jgi:type VI secretion system ImpC/EvpB family protein
MQMESWQELANPRDLTKIFQTPEYAAWRSLRESDDARYIGLTMPRFLARLPYGARTNPVEEFDFEEDTAGARHDKYTWANSAYAMAVNINRSFKYFGWCSRIRGVESGGAVEGLPTHTFPTDDGGVDMKCPTEIAISDRREAELAKNGFMPLIHKKIQTSPPLSAPSLSRSPSSTMTPTPRPTPTWRPACPTCSPPAGSRTISSASCATRSGPSRSVRTWNVG